MKYTALICFLIAVFVVGCSPSPQEKWKAKQKLVTLYGERFLSQTDFLDIVKRGNGVYSYMISKRRLVINVNFDTELYEVDNGNEIKSITRNSVERLSKIGIARFRYWKSALNKLDSYTISKIKLNCRCVFISADNKAPIGNDSVGWFYIPYNDVDSKRAKTEGITNIIKLAKSWYWGQRTEP